MQQNLSTNCNVDHLAKFLQLIGNPLRLEILLCLLEQPYCVCELSSKLNCRQPCISQHLMRLRRAGLVASQRKGWNRRYFISSKEIQDFMIYLLDVWQVKENLLGHFEKEEND